MLDFNRISVKNLDHLGIVAGLVDEIGIVDIVNNALGIDYLEQISKGQVVKAMILNGLGFVSRLALFIYFLNFLKTNLKKKNQKVTPKLSRLRFLLRLKFENTLFHSLHPHLKTH